jgi:DNA-binding PadR family transcriptional regulator
MSNMHEFERCTVLIFDALYRSFPKNEHLEPGDIAEDGEPVDSDVFYGTLEFLDQEGFIRLEALSETGGIASYVRLTLKGLALLRRVPDVLQSKATLGEQVGSATRIGFREIAKTVISEMVKVGIGVSSHSIAAQ